MRAVLVREGLEHVEHRFGFLMLGGGILGALLAAWIIELLRGLAGGALILLSVGPGATIGPSMVAFVSDRMAGVQALGQAMAVTGNAAGVLALSFFALLAVFTRPGRAATEEQSSPASAPVSSSA